MDIKMLVDAVGGKVINKIPKQTIKGISIDSRKIEKAQVFFAIKGDNFDGHDFINEAISKGAGAVVFSKDIDIDPNSNVLLIKVGDTLKALGALSKKHRENSKAKIVAVTGSNGKTTVKEMLFSILSIKGKTARNVGNFNNRIGLPLSVLQLDKDDKYGVFELGTSLFGEIEKLADILSPDAALITNIGYSHLETFVSPKAVFDEKKVLFDHIRAGGKAAINIDDYYLKQLVLKYPNAVTFSLNNHSAAVYAKDIEIGKNAIFELCAGGEIIKIKLPAKGEMNVLNAVSASAAAMAFGFNLDELKEGLEKFTPPQMRMQEAKSKQVALLINDAYNANPSSMRQSIKTVCSVFKDKKIVLVLGDMLELGEKSEFYHEELGKFINAQNIDSIYLTGENMAAAKEVIKHNVFWAQDHKELTESLKKAELNCKCVVLFKASRSIKLEEIYKALLP